MTIHNFSFVLPLDKKSISDYSIYVYYNLKYSIITICILSRGYSKKMYKK
nr:MAG TPA: hypothetical protein [Caudoviricetes sp.]